MSFETKRLGNIPDAIAPDGSEVRLLCSASRGSVAHFMLLPNGVSKAMAHTSVEEVWFFISGHGQMWQCLEQREEIVDVEQGVSITIPVGTRFQFRSGPHQPLEAVAMTMPPWPGDGEAFAVEGPWSANVSGLPISPGR